MAVVTIKPGGTLEWLCHRCGTRWLKDPLSMAEAASAHERGCGGPVRLAGAITHLYQIDDGELHVASWPS